MAPPGRGTTPDGVLRAGANLTFVGGARAIVAPGIAAEKVYLARGDSSKTVSWGALTPGRAPPRGR